METPKNLAGKITEQIMVHFSRFNERAIFKMTAGEYNKTYSAVYESLKSNSLDIMGEMEFLAALQKSMPDIGPFEKGSFEPKKTNWIKIVDDMPKHAQKVIGCHETSNGQDLAMVCFHKNVGRWVYFDSTFEHDLEVTHWMPLPEPPK